MKKIFLALIMILIATQASARSRYRNAELVGTVVKLETADVVCASYSDMQLLMAFAKSNNEDGFRSMISDTGGCISLGAPYDLTITRVVTEGVVYGAIKGKSGKYLEVYTLLREAMY